MNIFYDNKILFGVYGIAKVKDIKQYGLIKASEMWKNETKM